MKVLVTGAGGFVGRALVPKLLGEGYEISALVRRTEDISIAHPRLAWHVGDIRDTEVLREAVKGVDYIVHLAAAKSDEHDSHAINVDGAKSLIEAAQFAGVRGVVNLSTISTKFKQKGLYAATKSSADELFKKSGIPCVTLRSSVIYGGSEEGIVGSVIRYTRLPLTPVIGSGLATYRPIHVDDVVHAIEKVLTAEIATAATYDLGGPDTISFDELATLVARKVHEKQAILVHLPIPLAYALALFFKIFMRKPPISLSNVTGANQEIPVDIKDFNAKYDFNPHTLAKGLELVKKELAHEQAEPYVIMRYAFFGERPTERDVRLYEQAVKFYSLEHAPIDPSILTSSCRLKAIDALTRFTNPNGVFRRKLLIAATLAECSPRTAHRLLPRRVSLPSFLLQMCGVGLETAAALLYGLCLYPFVYEHISI